MARGKFRHKEELLLLKLDEGLQGRGSGAELVQKATCDGRGGSDTSLCHPAVLQLQHSNSSGE